MVEKRNRDKIAVKACPFCKSADLEPRLLDWGGTPDKYNCNNCGRILPFTIDLIVKKKLKEKKLEKTGK